VDRLKHRIIPPSYLVRVCTSG